MNHTEVAIAQHAIEEGRGLLVVVNKMDLLRDNQRLFEKVMDAVPREIQTVIPQVIVIFLVLNMLVFILEDILLSITMGLNIVTL